jgi:hypothetical protein
MVRLKIVTVIVLVAWGVIFLPRPVHAEDGCGLLGFVFGCRYDQRGQQIANDHAVDMAQIDAQAQAAALAAQNQAAQLETQRWLDSQKVQAQLEEVAARERVDMAKIRYELERMYSDERTSQLAATTSFNIAALQSDAMIAVARARANEAAAQQVTAALIVLAVLALAGAGGFAAWQFRRVAEVQAGARLLTGDDWQRRAVALLEQRRIPYMIQGQRLIAQIDGQAVEVRPD